MFHHTSFEGMAGDSEQLSCLDDASGFVKRFFAQDSLSGSKVEVFQEDRHAKKDRGNRAGGKAMIRNQWHLILPLLTTVNYGVVDPHLGRIGAFSGPDVRIRHVLRMHFVLKSLELHGSVGRMPICYQIAAHSEFTISR